MTNKKSNPTSSPIKPTDKTLCGHAMGIRSFTDKVSKIRFCTRPKDTCQYHT